MIEAKFKVILQDPLVTIATFPLGQKIVKIQLIHPKSNHAVVTTKQVTNVAYPVIAQLSLLQWLPNDGGLSQREADSTVAFAV